jgi:hypothetical protein
MRPAEDGAEFRFPGSTDIRADSTLGFAVPQYAHALRQLAQLLDGLKGVAHRLHPDAILAEHERVNAVHGPGSL